MTSAWAEQTIVFISPIYWAPMLLSFRAFQKLSQVASNYFWLIFMSLWDSFMLRPSQFWGPPVTIATNCFSLLAWTTMSVLAKKGAVMGSLSMYFWKVVTMASTPFYPPSRSQREVIEDMSKIYLKIKKNKILVPYQ